MNRYNIDPRQEAIRQMAADFAKKYIEPVSKELDHREDPDRFAMDLYKQLGKAGFIGINMPKELGGGGRSNLEYITLIEELCYHDAAACLLCAVGELATYPIIYFGSEEQKKKYVPKCASGEIIPAFVLTEPSAGSDAANQQTTAVLDGDHYVVNGEKIFIMHGDVADLFVLFLRLKDSATEDPGVKAAHKVTALIVEARQNGQLVPGIRVKTLKKKMGMRAATTGRIWFENLRVPKENLLYEAGKGFRIAMNTLDGARIGVAAQGVGIAQRALDESIAYAKKRICFGSPIGNFKRFNG
jgi:butyryl-CoA dehydrogenase